MPARLRDLVRVLGEFGISVTPGAKHFHARNATGDFYAIPAHNGLKSELSDVYIRGLCRAFALDEAELRKKL